MVYTALVEIRGGWAKNGHKNSGKKGNSKKTTQNIIFITRGYLGVFNTVISPISALVLCSLLSVVFFFRHPKRWSANSELRFQFKFRILSPQLCDFKLK